MFLVELVCCLSDFPSDYLQSNICMQSLPEVCLKTRNNRLDFGDDLECAEHHLIWISQICMKLLSKVCLCPRPYPVNCGYDPKYNRDLDYDQLFRWRFAVSD